MGQACKSCNLNEPDQEVNELDLTKYFRPQHRSV